MNLNVNLGQDSSRAKGSPTPKGSPQETSPAPAPASQIVLEIWGRATDLLRRRVGDRSFDLWFAHLKPRGLLKGVFSLGVPNLFIRTWLLDHYRTEISQAVEEALGTRVEIDFQVDGTLYQQMRESQMKELSVLESEIGSRLVSEQQEEPDLINLLEIPGNRLALRAGKRIVDHPGSLYNPLFCFGSEGCGKTYFLKAVARRAKERWPRGQSLYLTLDQFKNRFIYASRKHILDPFRTRFQSLDFLMIDDIHTIAGREGTQNELVALLRHLLGKRKQIIVASRVHPNEIPGLSPTLRGLLLSGMSTVMERPSDQNLVEVLRAKAERMKTVAPDDVLELIAQSTGGNPKKAMMALRKIIAYSALSGKAISVDLITRDDLTGAIEDNRSEKIREKIESLITWHFKVKRDLLYSKRKFKSVQKPRRLCMYLLRECAEVSTQELAQMFGNRSHVSAVSSVRRVEHEMAVDPGFRGLVTEFTRRVREEV